MRPRRAVEPDCQGGTISRGANQYGNKWGEPPPRRGRCGNGNGFLALFQGQEAVFQKAVQRIKEAN